MPSIKVGSLGPRMPLLVKGSRERLRRCDRIHPNHVASSLAHADPIRTAVTKVAR